jgi:hypothetical protein
MTLELVMGMCSLMLVFFKSRTLLTNRHISHSLEVCGEEETLSWRCIRELKNIGGEYMGSFDQRIRARWTLAGLA